MAFKVNTLLQNGHHESNDHQVLRVEDFRKIVFELYLIVYHHQNWKLPIIHEQENCIYYFPQKIFVRYNLQCWS